MSTCNSMQTANPKHKDLDVWDTEKATRNSSEAWGDHEDGSSPQIVCVGQLKLSPFSIWLSCS